MTQGHGVANIAYYGMGEVPYTSSVQDVYNICEKCGTEPLHIRNQHEQSAVTSFVQSTGMSSWQV